MMNVTSVHRRTAALVCSVARSGQAPKPHSGAPQARGLTANAPTEQSSVRSRCASSFDTHAAATSLLLQRNLVPSIHMRCMMTASRRATATIARFMPRCRAIFMPQALSHDHLPLWVIRTRPPRTTSRASWRLRISRCPPFGRSRPIAAGAASGRRRHQPTSSW